MSIVNNKVIPTAVCRVAMVVIVSLFIVLLALLLLWMKVEKHKKGGVELCFEN
jgi:hypothetical protein